MMSAFRGKADMRAKETKPSEGSTPFTRRGDALSTITSHNAPVPDPTSS
jgi:hypothetical protein